MKEYPTIKSLEEFRQIISGENSVMVYFSNDHCQVCKVLKPKVFHLVQKNYPKVSFFYVDTINNPEIAGQNTIFTVPVIVVFQHGKELLRKARTISLDEIMTELERFG